MHKQLKTFGRLRTEKVNTKHQTSNRKALKRQMSEKQKKKKRKTKKWRNRITGDNAIKATTMALELRIKLCNRLWTLSLIITKLDYRVFLAFSKQLVTNTFIARNTRYSLLLNATNNEKRIERDNKMCQRQKRCTYKDCRLSDHFNSHPPI